MTLAATRAERLSIGRVVDGTARAILAHPLQILVLSALIGGGPAMIALDLTWGLTTPTSAGAFRNVVLLGLYGAAMAGVLQGALAPIVAAGLAGQRADMADALRAMLPRALRLMGVSMAATVAAGFAALAFIVPAFFVLSRWFVAVQAVAVENLGFGAAFARSDRLTEGNRLAVFGIIVIVMGVRWLNGMAFGVLGSLAGDALAYRGFVGFASVVGAALSATAAAVVYLELRRQHEGPPAETVAEVFD